MSHPGFQAQPNPYAATPSSRSSHDAPHGGPGLKHSGLGIASLLISLVVGLGEFAGIVIAGIMESSTPGGVPEDHPIVALMGLSMCGGVLVAMVGIVLGIVGAVQRGRLKVFSILGISFNACIILGVIGLMIIGMLAGGA